MIYYVSIIILGIFISFMCKVIKVQREQIFELRETLSSNDNFKNAQIKFLTNIISTLQTEKDNKNIELRKNKDATVIDLRKQIKALNKEIRGLKELNDLKDF
jgi:hypothetical protein